VPRHVDQPRIVPVAEVRPRLPGVIDDRYAERLEAPRDGDAYAAEADHSDCTVTQRGAAERKITLGPFAVAQVTFGLRQLAHCVEKKTDRRVGDFLSQHVGGVRDDDAALCRRVRVDVVVADPKLEMICNSASSMDRTGALTAIARTWANAGDAF